MSLTFPDLRPFSQEILCHNIHGIGDYSDRIHISISKSLRRGRSAIGIDFDFGGTRYFAFSVTDPEDYPRDDPMTLRIITRRRAFVPLLSAALRLLALMILYQSRTLLSWLRGMVVIASSNTSSRLLNLVLWSVRFHDAQRIRQDEVHRVCPEQWGGRMVPAILHPNRRMLGEVQILENLLGE